MKFRVSAFVDSVLYNLNCSLGRAISQFHFPAFTLKLIIRHHSYEVTSVLYPAYLKIKDVGGGGKVLEKKNKNVI